MTTTDEEGHSSAYRWALIQIADATQVPFSRRRDVAYLTRCVTLAHTHAQAALMGKEPPPAPPLPGQGDLFAEGGGDP